MRRFLTACVVVVVICGVVMGAYGVVNSALGRLIPPVFSVSSQMWFGDAVVFALAHKTNKLESDLYILNSDGVRRIDPPTTAGMNAPVWVETPAWSADGRYIALVGYADAGGVGQVYSIRMGGPGAPEWRQLTHDGLHKRGVAWSPEGGRVAYIATDFAGYSGLWVVDADGNTAELRDDLLYAYEFAPRWSPDGAQIIIAGRFSTLIIDGTTGETWRELPIWTKNAVWSPDGGRIALFQAGDAHPEYAQGIYIYDVAADALLPSGSVDRHVFDLAWSPDGVYLAYMTYHSATDIIGRRAYLRRADGTGERRLLTEAAHEYNQFMRWSSDGAKIAFGGRNGLYITDYDGDVTLRYAP